MSYEGKHRRDDGGQRGGGTVKKVAGLTGLAATGAAVLTVGMGAGTANADGGILHNLFSPNKPSGSTDTANVTKPTSVFGSGFGQIITKAPKPTTGGISNYWNFNSNGWAVTGICLNPKGC